ncbi:MAG TPA: glycosyltransferase family 9 protein [bacterium]|nr:glycosyltransferase family 9 protein [bacterium]
MSRWKRQGKLWSKFLANCNFFRVGKNRLVIKFGKAIWFLLAWPFELVGDLLIWPAKFSRLPGSPRFLIVKVDQLGDVLFSTFLLPLIKKLYPESSIDYLVNPQSQSVLVNNQLVDNVFSWQDLFLQNIPGRQKLGVWSRIKLAILSWHNNLASWRLLRQRKYDVVINCRAFWPSSNWLWRLLGRELVAFDFSQASFLANYQADYDLAAEEWQNYLKLLEPLGVSSIKTTEINPRGLFFNIIPVADLPQNYWCLSAVSFDAEKTWSQKKWQEFIAGFLEKTASSLVLTGLSGQAEWLQKVAGSFLLTGRVLVFTNLNISQLAGLIKNSQGFIGLESFAAHLAIALERPAFCLVNSRLFYVPGLSNKKMIDGRSMLPQIKAVRIFDLIKTSPVELLITIFPA